MAIIGSFAESLLSRGQGKAFTKDLIVPFVAEEAKEWLIKNS
jgi:hypothetical protein